MVSLFHSIRFKLVLWFAGILAIVLAAFSVFVYVKQARDIQGQAGFQLERKLTLLEETLTMSPNGFLVPQGVLQDTDILILVAPDGSVVASRGPIPAQDASLLASAGTARAHRTHKSA